MGFQQTIILKERFGVEASMYKLNVSKRVHDCCSTRKVYRKGFKNGDADALVILPNPRNCLPLEKHMIYEVNPTEIEELRMTKVAAYPTEYQLMYLMERMGWNRISTIYLADLQADERTRLEHDLYFMNYNRYKDYSIFTKNRASEIERLMGPRTKIIAGWGMQAYLKNEATKALSCFMDYGQIYGLPHKIVPYYYHPYSFTKPSRMNWLDKIESQLRSPLHI